MDRSVRDDDREPFFHLSSSSSSPALAHLDTPSDQLSSAHDVLAGYNFQSAPVNRRRTFSVEQASSRRHRSSGSPVYVTGELFSARKDAEIDTYHLKTVSAVERTIKKYADNILRVLEGMNGRLSHLESVSQVLEQSVASLKGSVDDYHGEANTRLKALNSHVTEMHRAVQILRDKQDIVETNAELAKIQASKAEAVVQRASAFVPTTKPAVVGSSEVRTQEHLALALVAPKRSSTMSSQHSTEISGQLQQLSLSGDVNTTHQHIVPAQTQIHQQPHLWSPSESCPILQPQVMIQSTSGVFQAESQHAQTPQTSQPPQQGLLQTQVQQVQVQESVQYLQGVPEAQQYCGQTQQIAQSQQGAFQQHVQTQHIAHSQQGPFQQHVQAQHSVQVQQHETFQGQQQRAHIQQTTAQEEIRQTHQPPSQTQQNVPYQHSAYQAQAQYGLLQERIEAPQGVFQAQPQHVHIQQSVQSQQIPYQAQQRQVQTQQNAQSQQWAAQTQSQQMHSQAFRGPGQQLQPPPSPPPQTANQVASYSEQPQFQVAPQQLNMQQLATGQQPAVQIPHLQYGSRVIQSLPTQIDHGAGPHKIPYMASSQQYPLSSQPVQRAHDSNVYEYPSQGPMPVQRARPAIPSVTSIRTLPMAENVYKQANVGEPSTHLSHDDGIVEKLGSMGYARADVRSAIKRLMDQGKVVDVNAVLDLINARSQLQGGWQAG